DTTTDSAVPEWIKPAEVYFRTTLTKTKYEDVVDAWLDLESRLGYPDHMSRLSTTSRPPEIAHWTRRHRVYEKPPVIEKASEFGSTLSAWWTHLQPSWRVPATGNTLSRTVPEGETWEELMKGGGNGYFTVILALCWWM
ncbi:hypothetical protein BJ138DRAFT_964138, partial [Hygrophoropsis aurantiaca]